MIKRAPISLHANNGFSLLEVLVAFSIMAISVGIMLKIFSSGIDTAIVAEEYTIATQVAESLLAKTGVETPLVVGETSGIVGEKYHWLVNVDNFPNPGVEVETDQTVKLMEIQVFVRWGDEFDNNKRYIELNTTRTGPRL